MALLDELQNGVVPDLPNLPTAQGQIPAVGDVLDQINQHVDMNQKIQDMMHKQQNHQRRDKLLNMLSTFLFSVGQGLSVPPQVGGNGMQAAGAALQGPFLLQQMRQQQADRQAQQQAQMMQARAALQNAGTNQMNAQSLGAYRQMIPVEIDDKGYFRPAKDPANAVMSMPASQIGTKASDFLRSKATQEATTARAEMRAEEADKRQKLQFDFQKGLADINNDARKEISSAQIKARDAALEKTQSFAAQQNELNRKSRERIASLASAKKTELLDPDTVSWAADQIQRDATLMPTVTAGNASFKAQVAGELAKRGAPIMGLTAQTKNMAQSASDLLPSFDDGIKLTDKLASKLGPSAGRFNEFMAGRVGAGDPDFAKLRVLISMLSSGALRAHFGTRGGQQMFGHFKELMDSGKMDAPTLKASLEEMRDFLNNTYVKPIYKGSMPTEKADPLGIR